MKLLYLYVRNFGIFGKDHPVEMNFTGDYKFMMYEDADGHSKVRCVRGNGVPNNFYTLRKLQVNKSVSAISAIIGANGAGKSTIGTLLAIIRGSSSRHHETLLIWEKKGAWYLYTTIGNFEHEERILDDAPKCELVSGLGELQGNFDYVYFSPHFEPDNAFEMEFDSSACYNLSTSALFFTRPDKVLNKDLNRTDSVSFIRRAYELEQNLWIGRFLGTRNRWSAAAKQRIRLPKSISLSVYIDNDATKVTRDYFLERLQNETLSYDKSEREISDKFQSLRKSAVEVCTQLKAKTFGNDFTWRLLINYVMSIWRSIETEHRDESGLFMYRVLLTRIEEELSTDEKHNVDVMQLISDMASLLKTRSPKVYGKFNAAAKLFAMLLSGESVDADRNPVSCFSLYGHERGTMPYLDDSGLVDLFVQYSDAVFLYDFLEFKFTPAMSAGELVMLRLFGRLHWYLQPPSRGGDIAKHTPKRDVLIFLDEVETTLHPEWQRRIVLYLMWFFSRFAPKSKVHLIFATHSPILLSDIPAANCVFLERVEGNGGKPFSRVRDDVLDSRFDFDETFMANIHDLYSLPFFLKEGCAGRFATEKVAEALNPKVKMKEAERQQIFSMIGDPIIRRVVEDTWKLKKAMEAGSVNTSKRKVQNRMA